MAEKDPTSRLRRAVKENNLFLVKRLIQKTDMRNTDPAGRRYTSLALAAASGNEETFEYLLSEGHDDNELSRDSEGDSIIIALADQTPAGSTPSSILPGSGGDTMRAALRMAGLYIDRYPDVLDYANAHGRTALHVAVQKGNEEFVRMFVDFGADIDLSDEEGNTPLHYASMWGHISIVQYLIEKGCSYSAKNNERFTASDYAYSMNTRDTLQETAKRQIEKNKESRRAMYKQASARPGEFIPPPNPAMAPTRPRDYSSASRLRSGSGTSRTTNTSDSGDYDGNALAPPSRSQSSLSASSSPARPPHSSLHPTYAAPSSSNSATTLTALASRVREQDANAMNAFRRNRSGSHEGTSSTDSRSQNGSTVANEPSSARRLPAKMINQARRLRPSASAQQLRSTGDTNMTAQQHADYRTRAGTNPSGVKYPGHVVSRSSSTSKPPPDLIEEPEQVLAPEDTPKFTGPPSQYALFPDPPREGESPSSKRRMALYQGKSGTLDDLMNNHRRGMSAASLRGN